jgi:hypothetical protein
MQDIFTVCFLQVARFAKLIYDAVMNITPEQIINALGGTRKLAKQLSLSEPAVQAWKKRGIPPKHLLAYQRLFKRGCKLAEKAAQSPIPG